MSSATCKLTMDSIFKEIVRFLDYLRYEKNIGIKEIKDNRLELVIEYLKDKFHCTLDVENASDLSLMIRIDNQVNLVYDELLKERNEWDNYKSLILNPTSTVTTDALLINYNESTFRYRIPKECLERYMKPYTIINYIACGLNGCIFQICLEESKQCEYIMKIMMESGEEENEIAMTKLMSDNGIAPKMIASWSCDGEVNGTDLQWIKARLYFIVMKKMDMTLHKYIKTYGYEFIRKTELEKISSLVTRLNNDLHLAHNDLHLNNIMVNVDSNGHITDIKIIDFERTIPIDKDSSTNELEPIISAITNQTIV